MRIGLDIDGVLADFNTRFIERVIDIVGTDLFPSRPFEIPVWDYPQYYGYTEEEVSQVWAEIQADGVFWRSLSAYPETHDALEYLAALQRYGAHDVYYITSRPGATAKLQTEQWLAPFLTNGYGTVTPTVLISSEKGQCAEALKLDIYIDDRWENAMDVALQSKTKSYLLTRPWNVNRDAVYFGMVRLANLKEFISCIELAEAA